MGRHKKNLKRINSKFLLVVFFITMFLFGTSYAILRQELTLTGTVKMKANDEGTNLTITNFNTGINPIYTQYLFNIIPISGYKVVGITFQNTLSRNINNWTIEFKSNHNAETNKPTDNRLSEYFGTENAYGSITNSDGTVFVTGNDNLAPGESKTVYVFFSVNLLNNNFTFNDEKAYYTPPGGGRQKPSNNISGNQKKFPKFDVNSTDEFGVQICYDTTEVADKSFSTTMYIFIGNNTGQDVSNISFDVNYKDSNLSTLLSSSISILENGEKKATFHSDETISSGSCKGYIVTGLRTYGKFSGMNISNISYSKLSSGNNVDTTNNINKTTNASINDINVDKNISGDNKENIINKDNSSTDRTNSNTISNTITDSKLVETSSNSIIIENTASENSNNTITNEIINSIEEKDNNEVDKNKLENMDETNIVNN